MSRRPQSKYESCSIEARRGRLRLRWWWRAEDGRRSHRAHPTGLEATQENRQKLEPLREVVGRLVRAGKNPKDALKLYEIGSTPTDSVDRGAPPLGPTVRSYYPEWFASQAPLVRPALARDYRRHFEGYVLPSPFSDIPLVALTPKDARGIQAELLSRRNVRTGAPLSVKTVKNVISGSLRALWRQAKADELVTRDIFDSLTWPEWQPPDPDPWTAEEMRRIFGWFRPHRLGLPAAPRSKGFRRLPHPPFYAYVHTLFMGGGLRPSEASGLRWKDVNLAQGVLYVRRSYHLRTYGPPKIRGAHRTVELLPETVRVLRDIQPLHVTPEMPVFTSTTGGPIEPKSFSEHWYRCLRALGLRVRGLYTTKDTFVSLTLPVKGAVWVEAQTGVAYATLKRHYAKWVPRRDVAEQRRLERAFESSDTAISGHDLSPLDEVVGDNLSQVFDLEGDKGCEEGDLNPHGCYPTRPST